MAHPAAAATPATQPPSPTATPAPAPTATPTPRSPLSPAARPFYPTSSGRTKEARWMEGSDDDEEHVDYGFTPFPSPRPASYRDVVCGQSIASPSRASPSAFPLPGTAAPATVVATVAAAGREEEEAPAPARRRRRRPSGRARNRRAPPLRVEPPPPRIPPQARLGARLPRDDPGPSRTADRRRPRVDADGFEEVMSRSTRRRLRRAEISSGRSSASSPPRRIPPEMRDRCLNCLSYSHRVATCNLPPRCRRCHRFRHLAWQCRARSPPALDAAGGPRRFRVISDGSQTPPASQAPSRTPTPPPSPPSDGQEAARPRATARSTGRRSPACDDPECCYVERSEAMEAEETRLRFALLAVAGNASRDITTAEAARAIAVATGLQETDFVVKPSHPDNFLVECSSQSCRDRVLGASPIPLGSATLSLRQWTRLAHAEIDTMLAKINVEIDGIPPHAWDLDTASKLLAPNAWIESVDARTSSKEDLSTFKVSAWTRDPRALPMRKKLLIAEPEATVVHGDPDLQRIFGNLPPYLRQKRMLVYPIEFHLRTIAEFRPRSPSASGPSSPSDDGDSGPDGNPDRSYGLRQGIAGPRLSAFPRRDGRTTGNRGNGPGTGGRRVHGNGGVHVVQGTVGQESGDADAKRKGHPAFELEKEERRRTVQPVSASADQGQADGHALPFRTARSAELVDSLDVSAVTQREDLRDLAPDPMLIELEAVAADPKQILSAIQMSPELSDTVAQFDCPEERDQTVGGAPGDNVQMQPKDSAALEPASGPSPLAKAPEPSPSANPQRRPAGAADPDEMTAGEAPLSEGSLGLSGGPTTLRADAADDPAEGQTNTAGPNGLEAFTNSIRIRLSPSLLHLPDDRLAAAEEAATEQASANDAEADDGNEDDLLELPKLPKRSERLANQRLSCVPAARRGEIILMKKLGLADDTELITQATKNCYNEVYRTKLQPSTRGAIKEIFPAGKMAGGRAPTIAVV
ncbi:unnamed protein product [Urochloa humidicola]